MDSELERIIEKVEALPIEEIIGREINLRGSGVERDAICPFHNDRKMGNFKVNTSKGIWRCFACGEGGKGGASFYEKYHGVSRLTAVAEVGLRHHAITQEEANLLLKKAPSEKAVRAVQVKRTLSKPVVNEKLKPDELDQVYRLFISCGPSMTESFRENLIRTRHLDDVDLKFFFAMPRYSAAFMAAFYQKLRENGIQKDVLNHTPGIYFDTENNLYRFVDPGSNALGIIANDEQGRINGIQIRRETEDKKKRYIWFSSGFADGGNEKCTNGTINSGVIDVLPGSRDGVLACTEGKFKAIKLNKMGLTVLNMHGVTTWPAERVMQYAKGHGISKILLCYDADVSENDAVAKAALKFSKKLIVGGIQVEYLVWDSSYGKGVDDMINNGYQEQLSTRKAFNFNHYVLEPLVEKEQKKRKIG